MRMKKKGYAKGGKLKMVEKDGKKVPFYAADGKGKMKAGGSVKSVRKPKRVEKKVLGGILGAAAGSKAPTGKSIGKSIGKLAEMSPLGMLASGKMPKTGLLGIAYEALTGDGSSSSAGKKAQPKGKVSPAQIKAEAKAKGVGMKKGGSVKKKMGGGSMKKKGYAKGGMVCRGMGAATRGGKFNIK